jgi:undecaprenyl diphosphate synthase
VKGLSASAVTKTAAADAGLRHVAIIMDGNGRWAKRRFLPRVAGHRAGAEAVRKTVRAADDMGLETLTLYAFSSENWRRTPAEVSDLMGLLRLYLRNEMEEMHRNGIRLTFIGDTSALDKDLKALVAESLAKTANNKGLNFVLALNYGAHDEMTRAVRDIAHAVKAGRLDPDDVDANAIESRLDTSGLPPLDLLIRTSGERRLSNFLLWQAAYAELLFVDTLWPDFDGEKLAAAIADFGSRERRFGGR